MDCADEDVDLSIQIDNAIKYSKLGSITRELIGLKYAKEYLREKYKIDLEDVYFLERRKAIKSSKEYFVKTANGINLHSKNEQNRGNLDAACPVCNKEENWLHVISCCSTRSDKENFINELNEIEFEEYESNVAKRTKDTIGNFLNGGEYDDMEVKMVLRG